MSSVICRPEEQPVAMATILMIYSIRCNQDLAFNIDSSLLIIQVRLSVDILYVEQEARLLLL